ncbi:hypothetical protein ACEPPN_015784 [Leptodophora sp. 'Broadleaf-Isolate-01']
METGRKTCKIKLVPSPEPLKLDQPSPRSPRQQRQNTNFDTFKFRGPMGLPPVKPAPPEVVLLREVQKGLEAASKLKKMQKAKKAAEEEAAEKQAAKKKVAEKAEKEG